MDKNNLQERAVFGGGCFWCTEAVFQKIRGVIEVRSGYAGGDASTATYSQVSNGETKHAECVSIVFDPSLVTYKDLLSVFFASHDPTQIGGQGNDIGDQYRSVIFYTSEEQKKSAVDLISEIESEIKSKLATEVLPLAGFFESEEYHKNYYNLHKDAPYCTIVIGPKIKKIEDKYAELLKSSVNT